MPGPDTSPDQHEGGGRRGSRSAGAATAVLLVVGVLLLLFGVRGQPGPPQPPAGVAGVGATSVSGTDQTAPSPSGAPPPGTLGTSGTTGTPGTSGGSGTTPPAADPAPQGTIGPFLGASAPTGIDIPAIGVQSTSFVDLGVAADGTITVPGSANEVGFYTGGPTPGQLGPAVLAAHVDSKQGPGIFYRLGAVKAGDHVIITRADGVKATFLVDQVASYPKDQFPTEQVYHGSFDRSEIGLVTCGGTFDEVKHYLDNVIVFAHLQPTA